MQKPCRIDTEWQTYSGMDQEPGVTPEIYEQVLDALRNLGDATKLAKSALSSSCVVSVIVKKNPAVSRPESLQAILTELLDLLDLGAREYAVILRARFWERMTLQEFCDSDHNPDNLAIRTIQEKQKDGIYKLAAWFIEKEAACKEAAAASTSVKEGLHQTDVKLSSVISSTLLAEKFDEPTAQYYVDDFSNHRVGTTPAGWSLYGGKTDKKPTVEYVREGQKEQRALVFPAVEKRSINKDLILDEPAFQPPYQATVRLRFLNEPADRAGLILAWQGRGRLIRAQANLHWNHIEFWEYHHGPYKHREKAAIYEIIDVDTYYWLRVIASKPDQQRISVLWSADGTNYSHIMTTNCKSTLEGKIGLSTSGPNLPHTQFSRIEVAYTDTL